MGHPSESRCGDFRCEEILRKQRADLEDADYAEFVGFGCDVIPVEVRQIEDAS